MNPFQNAYVLVHYGMPIGLYSTILLISLVGIEKFNWYVLNIEIFQIVSSHFAMENLHFLVNIRKLLKLLYWQYCYFIRLQSHGSMIFYPYLEIAQLMNILLDPLRYGCWWTEQKTIKSY